MSNTVETRRIEDFEVENEIGRGSSAKVLKCRLNGKTVAVKQYYTRKAYTRELKNLERLQTHDNVLKFLMLVTDRKHKYGQGFMVALEYLPFSIEERLYDAKLYPNLPLLRWATEIASGLNFMHQRGVVHFDLKPENLLLDQDLVVKIADFSIARRSESLNAEQGATVVYCAPEVAKEEPGRLTGAVDVYSFAIVLWEMVHRKEAYSEVKLNVTKLWSEIVYKDLRPTVDALYLEDKLTASLIDIIKVSKKMKEVTCSSCCSAFQASWKPEPTARPTIEDTYSKLLELV